MIFIEYVIFWQLLSIFLIVLIFALILKDISNIKEELKYLFKLIAMYHSTNKRLLLRLEHDDFQEGLKLLRKLLSKRKVKK